MATLLLSSLGTAVGGPIGGLIGAVAGRAFDSQVLGLGNQRIEGPRQENLDIQSGSYGGTIPLLFGTGRYAGNVIWSTGLIESREEESQGGKGGPSVTAVTYSYAASFAVGVCQGPIQSIGRIWADGKLIRSAGGDLSVGGELRVYLGDQDQLPDPLMEGDIGVDATPAFRGLAYCVFEMLPLAEFGNRIPNLTFEVIEADTVTIVALAERLIVGAGLKAATDVPSLDIVGGYQVSGTQSYRDGLSTLTDLYPLQLVASGESVSIRTAPQSADLSILQSSLGARSPDAEVLPRIHVDFDHALDLPSEVSIAYADPATDYQDAVQRAQKVREAGDGSVQIRTAMMLSAVQARALAVKTLSRLWDERLVLSIEAGLEASQLEPGDLISVEIDEAQFDTFEIIQATYDGLITSISARARRRDTFAGEETLPSYSGEVRYTQYVSAPQIAATVFELPPTTQFGQDIAVHAAVARAGGSSNSAGLYISQDNGANFALAAQVPTAAVTGVCMNGLEDRNAALFDYGSHLDVVLDHADMALSSRPALAILNGANLAMVGTELLQFQMAELLDTGAYRLSGLLRGRGGTETVQMGLASGQTFILLQSGDIATQSLTVTDLGTSALFKIVPNGQSLAEAAAQSVTFMGKALMPLSPVHLKAQDDGAGGFSVTWVRRSRTGFGWVDGVDAPVGESMLAFRITYADDTASFSRDVPSEMDALTAADISSSLTGAASHIDITIAQLSDVVGAGPAATLTVLRP